MKANIFSRIAILLMTLMILITVSCKKKISKEDLEYQVGQAISEYYFEKAVDQYSPLFSRENIGDIVRFETKVSLIKETENKYIGDAVIELWEPDQHGGDGPGRKETEEKHTVNVTVDPEDGSFRWELK